MACGPRAGRNHVAGGEQRITIEFPQYYTGKRLFKSRLRCGHGLFVQVIYPSGYLSVMLNAQGLARNRLIINKVFIDSGLCVCSAVLLQLGLILWVIMRCGCGFGVFSGIKL